jgi:hypothetical protein
MILLNHLLDHYEHHIPGYEYDRDDDMDYDDEDSMGEFEDSEDFELFLHALMRKGHDLYQQLVQSEDPFSLLTDMMHERSDEFDIE